MKRKAPQAHGRAKRLKGYELDTELLKGLSSRHMHIGGSRNWDKWTRPYSTHASDKTPGRVGIGPDGKPVVFHFGTADMPVYPSQSPATSSDSTISFHGSDYAISR